MKTEKKIKLASYFIKLLMVITLTIIIGFIFFYFSSMFSPEKYSNYIVSQERTLVYNVNIEKVPETYKEWQSSNKLFYYTKLDEFSKFSLIWTKVVGFVIFFFILVLFNKFLKNTKKLEFFFQKNIKTISHILKLLVLLFVFNIIVLYNKNPMSMVFEETEIPHYITTETIRFNFLFYYPLAIIFFYILREVFKRGQELKQENDLTI